ncbi:hypothetical protein GCM10010216_20180 [Streptomyces flaveolus]|nr:hypothetical protein GCM10010216_20180 [Streptomyces flaveolus]
MIGPVVKALPTLAALMDADLRKSARRGQRTSNLQLIMRACYDPLLTMSGRRRPQRGSAAHPPHGEDGGEGAHGSSVPDLGAFPPTPMAAGPSRVPSGPTFRTRPPPTART